MPIELVLQHTLHPEAACPFERGMAALVGREKPKKTMLKATGYTFSDRPSDGAISLIAIIQESRSRSGGGSFYYYS